MAELKANVLVLDAGMAGVGAALHLQKRGRDAVLIDRHELAGEEPDNAVLNHPMLDGDQGFLGHRHHGLTLGPATGCLLAEVMTGENPFC
jgi:glycine/D-amino acid oxidase-like deaminating enzyme